MATAGAFIVADGDTTLPTPPAGHTTIGVKGGALTLKRPDGTEVPTANTGRNTIVLLPGNLTARAANGAQSGVIEVTTATVDARVPTLDFDTAAAEVVYAVIVLPKSYDGGTLAFDFRAVLAGSTAGQTGILKLQARFLRHDDDPATVVWGGARAATATATATAGDVVQSTESAAITPGGAYAEGCELGLRIERDVAADTAAGDLRLRTLRLYFVTNAGNDA